VDAPTGTPAAILALLRAGPRQAKDLARELAIDTSAVRRHLETLRAGGFVVADDEIAGRGRPKKMYGLTPQGRETFRRDYALLLDLVLDKLAQQGGPKAVESLLRLIATDIAQGVDGATHAERVRRLVSIYNELGFEASVVKEGRSLVLVQHNCIFLKTAQKDPRLLCQCLDEGIMHAALPAARIELRSSIALGQPHCAHVIDVERGRSS